MRHDTFHMDGRLCSLCKTRQSAQLVLLLIRYKSSVSLVIRCGSRGAFQTVVVTCVTEMAR